MNVNCTVFTTTTITLLFGITSNGREILSVHEHVTLSEAKLMNPEKWQFL